MTSEKEFTGRNKKARGEGLVRIHIEGAVKNPGTYVFRSGVSIKEILKKAELLPKARIWGFKAKEKIREDRSIYVPSP